MSGWFDFNGYAFYDRPEHPGVYADLVTALGFKPSVASAKEPGGFDSHPLPLQSKNGFDPSFTGSEPFRIGPDVWSPAATPGHLRTSVTTTSMNFRNYSAARIWDGSLGD